MSQEVFHFSLYVRDVKRSAQFYESLFGEKPEKLYDDYAKFELKSPPVVLSLEKLASAGDAPRLSHLGIKLKSKSELLEWTSKIAERGMPFEHLDQVACCYADQSKIFANDPDGNLVEVYMVNRDLDGTPAAVDKNSTPAPNFVGGCDSYDHMLPSAFPAALPAADGSLSKVALRGTLNAEISSTETFRILAESYRALKPGGIIMTHMLVADQEVAGALPHLPEPASHVRRIPTEENIWTTFREAGYLALRADRLSPHHVFAFGGAHFRELLLTGVKPFQPTSGANVTAVYKGPFPSVELESGTRLMRGVRQSISAADWEQISLAPFREQFVAINDAGQTCAK